MLHTVVILYATIFIAVCTYRLVMMSINLSKKFTLHVQTVTGSADVIVTQLLCYHMLLLYFMQPLIYFEIMKINRLHEIYHFNLIYLCCHYSVMICHLGNLFHEYHEPQILLVISEIHISLIFSFY